MSCCGTWSGSMHNVHITLQELQAVTLMLHKVTFQLTNEVVALHLDTSTAKAYLCKQCGTASILLSRLVCHILNLANNYSIAPHPAYIYTFLNVEANYLSWSQLIPKWHLLPHIAQAAFSLESARGGSVGILVYQSMSGLLHLGKSPITGIIGVECFQRALELSGELCVSSSCFSLWFYQSS